MRILIATGLYPPEIGGPATYSAHLKRSLPAHGIEVVILPFSRVRQYWKVVRHLVYFYLAFKEGKRTDLIYAQDPVSVGVPALCAAFLLRKPYMLKIVGDYAWEQASQRFGYAGTPDAFQDAEIHIIAKIFRTLERFVARQAHVVVVPSKYLGGIVRLWGVPEEKIAVIKNGIESFQDTGSKSVIRGLFKFHGKLIISVGRLVPWKGFDLLIRILPAIKKNYPDTKLLIIGSGPLMDVLEKKSVQMGLMNDVVFTGALERDILIRYIRASDVFALNTSYEGLSHQILEVMAVGVPVVTTRVGGNPEVITHGVDGYLLKHNDAKGFRETIMKLLGDSGLRTRTVANAKRKITQFSNERMVAETAALLKTI